MVDMKKAAQDLFALADINIDGSRPWDIQVHNPQFYARVLSQGSLGLGESYMDGWWDCKSLDQFFCKLLEADLDKKVVTWKDMSSVILAKLVNLQSASRAYEVGRRHYDLGNNLYKHMLDKRMVYSCGYWKEARTLDKAQEAKLELICKKISLRPGMKVLDIGCGWGSFAKYAAKKYKVSVLGITISKEQMKLAKEECKGLPIEIRLQDYRLVKEKFDRIVSVGMFEHVGVKNYRTYMKVVHRCLKDGGLFLLHTIGNTASLSTIDSWIGKYIFPNALIPSIRQVAKSMEGLFVMEDWHNFGQYYDNTTMAWFKNFDAHWYKLKKEYDERFYRMWKYYLLSGAGNFRVRKNQLWQIVFSKEGVKGGYQSIR